METIDRKKLVLAGGLTAVLLGAFLLGGVALGGAAAATMPAAPAIAPHVTSWWERTPLAGDRSRAGDVKAEGLEESEGND